eukprot:CAMPEP_0182530130 /NCGR_PEP_ID=MMETSP1323-20130603/5689_1 /TAXON_ID=236787 /ORGANISM="Florenciella parvula, Strain RCC1693" /LENGTH=227 /DNA_ID=CAMNT_0024739397 /DNA_START=58 /DNA_END=741 /DNA_ORIENTATION=-
MRSTVLTFLLALGSAAAFVPAPASRTSRWAPTRAVANRRVAVTAMSDEETSSAMIPVTAESIKATSAIVGGIAGLAFGGPVFGILFAAATNFIATQENEVSEVALGVGQVSLQTWNFVLKLNGKYDLVGTAGDAAGGVVDKIKEKDENGAIEKVEIALETVTSKIRELNAEYDLGEKAASVLGSAGKLSNKAIEKGLELNEEYEIVDKVSEKAKETAATVVAKAKKE